MKQMLRRFSELASRYNLFLSSQEVLQRAVFGMDIRSRKLLLLLDTGTGSFEERLIPLRAIRTCTVRKQYRAIKPGTHTTAIAPDSVELQLDLAGMPPLTLPFFEKGQGKSGGGDVAEQKAQTWAHAIRQLLKIIHSGRSDAENAANRH